METSPERPPITEEQRAAAAAFIHGSLRPVRHAIHEGRQSVAQVSAEQELTQEFETRGYQLDALVSLWDARAAGHDKALLHLATGLGKTTVAALDVMKFREECAQQPQPLIPRVLYVSHKNEINEQAEATFKRHMPDLETATFNTRQKQLPDADVTFATFQSLHGKLDRFDPQDYEYIVWDEGHHTKAETYMEVVKYFDPLFEMAITATPDRMDGQDIREYFGEEVYSKGLPEAIAEGWLANVDYQIVFDKAIKDAIADGFNPKTLKDIKELFAEKPPAAAIAKNIREEIAKLGLENPKTIIFCTDIAEADEMAELLGGTAYHSDTKDRPSILQDFRTGRERIITTRDMFNEGVDIPDAELIIFLRSTASNNIFEQQLGRGLRLAPGKDKVYVLDFVANIERIAKIRELGQAIQQRTVEIGEQTSEEGVILGAETDEPGLRIRSHHGNFDFDKIAVDLLEKWGGILADRSNKVEWIKWDNASIIELADRLAPGEPLRFPELKRLSASGEFPTQELIRERFGSLVNFHRARGFEVKDTPLRKDWSDWSADDMIERALDLIPDAKLTKREIDKLAQNNLLPTAYVIKKTFGSVTQFHEACGFEAKTKVNWTQYSDQDLIDLAKNLSPDAPLGASDMDNSEGQFPTKLVIQQRFGTIYDFQKACGFEVRKRIAWSKKSPDEIIALAKDLSPDTPITQEAMRQYSKEGRFPNPNIITKMFGSTGEFHRICGFTK